MPGCWGPGLGWDSQNAAQFVGPRQEAWPFGACVVGGSTPAGIGGLNALKVDPVSGALWAEPADIQVPHTGSWSWGTPGVANGADLLQIYSRYSLTPTGLVNTNSGFPVALWPTPGGCPSSAVCTYGLATLTASVFIATACQVSIYGDANYAPSTVAVGPTRQVNSSPVPQFELNQPTAVIDSGPFHQIGSTFGTGCIWSDYPYGPPWFPATASQPFYGSLEMVGPSTMAALGCQTGTGAFSLSCWALPTNTAAGIIFSTDQTGSAGYPQVAVQGQRATPTSAASYQMNIVNSGGGSVSIGMGSGAAGGNTMDQLGITYDGSRVYAYINGVQVSSYAVTLIGTSGIFRVGVQFTGSAYTPYSTGYFAHALSYTSNLSTSAMAQLFNTPLAPPAGYYTWYPMNKAYPRRLVVQAHGVMGGTTLLNPSTGVTGVSPTFQVTKDLQGWAGQWEQGACYLESALIEYDGLIVTSRATVS